VRNNCEGCEVTNVRLHDWKLAKAVFAANGDLNKVFVAIARRKGTEVRWRCSAAREEEGGEAQKCVIRRELFLSLMSQDKSRNSGIVEANGASRRRPWSLRDAASLLQPVFFCADEA
jgi:hypothetical protein